MSRKVSFIIESFRYWTTNVLSVVQSVQIICMVSVLLHHLKIHLKMPVVWKSKTNLHASSSEGFKYFWIVAVSAALLATTIQHLILSYLVHTITWLLYTVQSIHACPKEDKLRWNYIMGHSFVHRVRFRRHPGVFRCEPFGFDNHLVGGIYIRTKKRWWISFNPIWPRLDGSLSNIRSVGISLWSTCTP